MKDLKESVYHGAVISPLAVGFTMLGKSLIKMNPPHLSVSLIIAISDFYKRLSNQAKIIPDNI